MKHAFRLWLASAMIVALAQAASAVEPASSDGMSGQGWSGYLDFHGGGGIYINRDGSGVLGQLGGAGRASFWVTPSTTAQFDVWDESLFGDAGFNPLREDNYGVAAHLGHRNPAASYFGAMVSVGSAYWPDERFVVAALEGQSFRGPTTYFWQTGYALGIAGPNHAGDVYGYGGARHFFTPNLMGEINGGVSFFKDDVQSDAALRWGARLEYKKDDHPVSLYVAYEGEREFWDSSWRFSDHLLMLGARLHFDQGTLRDFDRNGASLADYNPMYGQAFEH